MHIKKSVLAFAALVALFAAISGVPTAYAAAEQVTHYDVVVHVNTDASVDVDEDINYDFGDANKHGIYRDVPVIYKTKSGANMRLDLQNISVVDGAGQPYQFTTSSNGNDRRIKIGNPNVLITGSHLYVLHYSVPHAVGFFDGFDEIYWNAVGTGWTVPIYNATARVVLPKSFAFADVKSSCYAGAYSFDTPCSTMQPMIQQDENKAPVVDTVVFTQGSLQPAQGLTVAVGFPKGIIDSSTAPSQITNQVLGFWQDGWLWFVVPIIVFILMFRRWYTHGRDPKGTGVIVAQYESPDGLTPMQIGYMADQGFSNSTLAGELINLAVLGYIKVTRIPATGVFGSDDYEIKKIKEADEKPGLNAYQIRLFFGLFKENTKNETVLISSLRLTFYEIVNLVNETCLATIVEGGYYPKDGVPSIVSSSGTSSKWARLATFIFLTIFFSVWAGVLVFIITQSGLAVIAFCLSLTSFSIFQYLMPRVTEKGALIKEKIEGFRLYMSVAEKDRLNFHDAPKKDPTHFQKLLPYAIALGVERQWAQAFQGIDMKPPSWYSDPTYGGIGAFNATMFASSMSLFASASSSAMSSAPGSSSGSGGGGFSGGGGGGGGGGSW